MSFKFVWPVAVKMFTTSTVSTMVIATALTPELTTSVSIVIASVFVGLVNLYVARTARMVAMKEVARVMAPIQIKVEEMAPVLAKVEAHVNSEKTKAEGDAFAKDLQIKLQQEMIEEMRKAAALLAQARVSSEMVSAVTHVSSGVPDLVHRADVNAAAIEKNAVDIARLKNAPASSQATDSLQKIDTNTAAIEKNTAKTDATVQELKKS